MQIPEKVVDLVNRMRSVRDISELCTPYYVSRGRLPVKPQTTTSQVDTRPVSLGAGDLQFDLSTLDVEIFTLAPVYYYAGVGADILHLFTQSDLSKPDDTITVYQVPFELVSAGPVSRLVYLADTEVATRIFEFTDSVGFFDEKAAVVCNVARATVARRDPRFNTTFRVSVMVPRVGDVTLLPVVSYDGNTITFQRLKGGTDERGTTSSTARGARDAGGTGGS